MTSTECPEKLNTLVNNEQENKPFSRSETNEKHPISSVQKNDESEGSVEVLNQFEESIESAKSEPAEGQLPFEVFNETECMKFAEKFHKIVEELKLDRIGEKENELRIQKLMSEKSDLERLKDEEVMKNSELIQKHGEKNDEARKLYEEKLHSLQENKTKHMLEKQSGEKEIKALKDEIRSLHITKYTMEKLIKDQERQLQSHGTNNANYLTQLSKLEKQCKDVFKQYTHIITAINKVEVNVSASMKLHKKLTFINEHQNCILEVYKEKLDKNKQDLITSEAKRASSSNDEINMKESPSLVHLEDELRMQKELCHQVQVQLNDTRQENQELLKSLNNAHELLGKQVETNNKFVETDAITQLELDELRTECGNLREELKTQRTYAEEKEAHIKEIKTAQEEKEKELGENIEQLKISFELLNNEKVMLEQLNSTWSQKNVEQRDEMENMTITISELKSSMEEAKKEMGMQCTETKRLEGDLNNEVNRYRDLLRKAQQETSHKTSETMKLNERTAELQKNEEKMKIEMEKLKSEKINKRPKNQFVQTEVMKTKEKETNTITISDLQLTTTSRQPETTGENGSTAEPPGPKTPEKNVQDLDKAQHDSPANKNQETDNIPEQHFTDMHYKQAEELHREMIPNTNNTQGQSDTRNISLGKSVSEITTLVQDKYSGNPTLTSDKVKTSVGSTGSTLNTTTNEKQLPSAQDSSSLNSPSLQRTTDEELTTAQKILPEDIRLVKNDKCLLPSKDHVGREPMLRSRIGEKRVPLLAVVKPALSSRGRRENVETSSPSVHSNQPQEDNSSTHPGMTTNIVHDLPCEVVQRLSAQTESQNMPLSEPLVPSKVDCVVISDEPTHKSVEVTVNWSTNKEQPTSDEPQNSDSNSATTDQALHKSTTSSVTTTNDEHVERNDDTRLHDVKSSTAKDDRNQESYDVQMDGTATKNDGKSARTTGVEEFCFSDDDEEEESMPKTIGTQIDRIEAFLKNDRLRLCKKRKISHE